MKPHHLRHPSHPGATTTPILGPHLDHPSARSGGPGGGGGQQQQQQSMNPSATVIKQETNVVGGSTDLMVPGQTHIGSPGDYNVDSTTYHTRLTPPGSNPPCGDYFSMEELLNGITILITDFFLKITAIIFQRIFSTHLLVHTLFIYFLLY